MADPIMIRNAKIWIGEGFVEANILVEDGIIAAISKRQFKDVDMILDAYGQPVIPGGIDIHAHVYDPEYTINEDWESGTLAAAFGSITTVYDMPLRVNVDNPKMLKEKIEAGKKNAYINFGVHAGFMTENNYNMIPKLAEKGVKGFKVFTCRPFMASDKALVRILELVRDVDGLVLAHSEDDALIDYGESKHKDLDDIVAYHMSRSDNAEAAAIMRLGYYARETRGPLHICHISSKEGVDAIRYLRSRGVKLTVEVCPHHLHFTRDDSAKYGSYLKLAPTLKTAEDREALWQALADGTIDAYVSDNAPAPRIDKEKNVWRAWGGIPTLEIMGPYLYTYGVLKGRISFGRFVEVFSTNPAKIMGIYPRKGVLALGADADLVVLETRVARKITASDHHHKVDWTPWEKMELYGYPLHLLVNGEVVIRERNLVANKGVGRYIDKRYVRM